MKAQREAIYGRGWLLTHFLMFDKARRDQLPAYIRAINDGKPVAEAARVFGDPKALGRELDSYLNRRRLTAFTVSADKIKVGEVKLRTLGAGEAATMPVRIRSKRGVDKTEAKLVAIEARKRAAPYPADAAAQIVLAEAEYDAGQFDAAEAAADRALAADPKAIDALVYKGMARMARGERAADTAEATWKEVRRLFARANRLDPDDPEPLILFYSSYAAQGIAPTANAAMGLETAFLLAPQDRSLRVMAARQLVIDGKVAAAKTTLRPIAYDPHGGSRAQWASAQIALLDKGDGNAALAAWGRPSSEGGE